MVKRSATLILLALVVLLSPNRGAAQDDINQMIALEEELPDSLHPFELFQSQGGAHLSALMNESLVRLNPKRNLLEPNLIGPLEKESGRSFKATIRSDVEIKWQDGRKLIPRDVVRSYERLSEMASDPGSSQSVRALANIILGIRGGDSSRREGGISSIVEQEGGELIFNFRRPTTPGEALQVLSVFMVLPAHVVDSDLRKSPVGLGPYRVPSEWDGGDVILERHDEYFRGAPNIRRMRVQEVPRYEDRLARISTGDAHIAVGILEPFAQESLKVENTTVDRTDLRIQPQLSRAFYYVGFNMDRGFAGARLGDRPWLRQAINLLLSRVDLLNAFGGDEESGVVVTGPFRPDSAFASRRVDPPQFSDSRIKELFESEGYEKVAQFYEDSSGTELKITLAFESDRIRGDDSPPSDMERIATAIQTILQAGGIRVDLAPRSAREFDVLLTGEDRRFDAVLHAWNIDESEEVYDIFHSKGVYNFLHFESDVADANIEQALRAGTPAARMHYRWKLHELLAEEVPAAFLWSPKLVAIFDARIVNVPILDPYYFYRDVHKWQVVPLPEPERF